MSYAIRRQETTAHDDVHLDRELEWTLSMLIRLREMQKETASA